MGPRSGTSTDHELQFSSHVPLDRTAAAAFTSDHTKDQWCGWELCSFAPVSTPNSDVTKSWNPPALPCSKVNGYKVSKDKIFKGSYSDYTILLNYTFLKESFLVARLQQSYHEIQKGFDRMRLAITLWMLHDKTLLQWTKNIVLTLVLFDSTFSFFFFFWLI